MPVCRRCQGEGQETYDEDGRTLTDVCYHCAGSGQVEEELDFHDRLVAVANSLAYMSERDYRKACDQDPDGDDYCLRAAENGLSESDYFKVRVWDREALYMERIQAMDRATQELLVEWNETDQGEWSMEHLPKIPSEEIPVPVSSGVRLVAAEYDEDEIPF